MTLKLLLAGKQIADFEPIKQRFANEDVVLITASSMALAIFLARKNQPDLIISQEILVDSNGINFFHELKNEEELSKIPFVLIKDIPKSQKDNLEMDTFKNAIDSGSIKFISIDEINSESQVKELILSLL